MDGPVLQEKSYFKVLWLSFSSKLDWGSSSVSIAKTAKKKIGALICSMKFFSPDVALYHYKSTIQPYKEYCWYVWTGAPNCYLDILNKLQKWCVGPSVGPTLLGHRRNVASWSLSYNGITLVDVHLNWLNWFRFLILKVRPLAILIICMIFLSQFLDVIGISMSKVSFLPWLDPGIICLQCFPLIYDLNWLKSRIVTQLLSLHSS